MEGFRNRTRRNCAWGIPMEWYLIAKRTKFRSYRSIVRVSLFQNLLLSRPRKSTAVKTGTNFRNQNLCFNISIKNFFNLMQCQPRSVCGSQLSGLLPGWCEFFLPEGTANLTKVGEGEGYFHLSRLAIMNWISRCRKIAQAFIHRESGFILRILLTSCRGNLLLDFSGCMDRGFFS